jgi:hypothetical protein
MRPGHSVELREGLSYRDRLCLMSLPFARMTRDVSSSLPGGQMFTRVVRPRLAVFASHINAAPTESSLLGVFVQPRNDVRLG